MDTTTHLLPVSDDVSHAYDLWAAASRDALKIKACWMQTVAQVTAAPDKTADYYLVDDAYKAYCHAEMLVKQAEDAYREALNADFPPVMSENKVMRLSA